MSVEQQYMHPKLPIFQWKYRVSDDSGWYPMTYSFNTPSVLAYGQSSSPLHRGAEGIVISMASLRKGIPLIGEMSAQRTKGRAAGGVSGIRQQF